MGHSILNWSWPLIEKWGKYFITMPLREWRTGQWMEASPQRTADKEIHVWWWWGHKFRVRSKPQSCPSSHLQSDITNNYWISNEPSVVPWGKNELRAATEQNSTDDETLTDEPVKMPSIYRLYLGHCWNTLLFCLAVYPSIQMWYRWCSVLEISFKELSLQNIETRWIFNAKTTAVFL